VSTPKAYIRLTHTGLLPDGRPNTQSVLIQDLDVGYENQLRKVPVYVPVGVSPYVVHPNWVDVLATSRSLISYESGYIRKAVTSGVITARMMNQPEAYTNLTRPSAALYPIGASIWNTNDNALNYSDGTAWRDAMGVIT
jgi:hypothetical protein